MQSLSMKIHFTLSRPDSDQPTAIKLRFSYRKNFHYGTGIQIHPDHWNFDTQRAKEGTAIPLKDRKAYPEIKNQLAQINAQLRGLITTIDKYDQNCKLNQQPFDFTELRNKLDTIVKPDIVETVEQDPEKIVFIRDYIAHFIDGITTGEITTQRDTKYSPGTIKAYRGFQMFWSRYETDVKSKFRFDDIDMKFYRSFVRYCHKKKFRYNYTGRLIKDLKAIMRASYKEGLHHNLIFKNEDFKTLKTKVDEVYLTEQELRQLYQLDLSNTPRLEKHRDIFLIGCYTALRFSDIVRITPDHIKHDPDSDRSTLEIITRKTKAKVYIPIKPELLTILQKYEYRVPKVFEQKVNADIKEVARMAGISGTLSKMDIIGGKEIIREVPRYEMVKTHTARRTAATLMYIAGIPTLDIMKITGHHSEDTFLNYIRITNKQNAERLHHHPYFSGTVLKKVN